MYRLRVVATTPSKPSSFASTVTREQTELDDRNGVWQKDRGGKFNNYLNVDLEVQDDQGYLVPLDEYFPVEAELRIVMEDGQLGGVIDRVTTESRRVMNKHLEGGAGKLMIIDADPQTRGGIRVGGTSRTTIKTRINELSKKGSRNSRFSVVFRPLGIAADLFIRDDLAASSKPLTIYSKVVRSAKDEVVNDHLEQAKLAAKTLLSEVEKVDPSKTSVREAQVVVEILEACRLIQKKLQWQQTRLSQGGKSANAFETLSNAAAAASASRNGASSAVSFLGPRPSPPADRQLSFSSFGGQNDINSSSSSLLFDAPETKRMRTGSDRNLDQEWSGRLITLHPTLDAPDDFSIEFLEEHIREMEDEDGEVNMTTHVNVTDRGISIDLFDENADGQIDRSDMKRAIARLEIPLTEEMHKRIFEEFDLNKDGVITVQEFIEGVRRKEAELRPLFRQIDLDGDGYLTYEELRHSSLLQSVSNEAIMELISFVDSLSTEAPDGRISEAEFISTFTMLPSGDNLASLQTFANQVSLQRRTSMS